MALPHRKSAVAALVLVNTTLLAAAAGVLAQPPAAADPVLQFRSHAVVAHFRCTMSTEVALLGGAGPDADYRSCIAQTIREATPRIDSALAALTHAGAREAFKAYAAAWIAAVRGLAPVGGEAKLTYRQRQAEAKSRLDELWARLELELRSTGRTTTTEK